MSESTTEAKSGVDFITLLGIGIVGGIILAVLFKFMWSQDSGILAEWGSWRRLIVVLAAILLGGLIGWLTYPRVPFASLWKKLF